MGKGSDGEPKMNNTVSVLEEIITIEEIFDEVRPRTPHSLCLAAPAAMSVSGLLRCSGCDRVRSPRPTRAYRGGGRVSGGPARD
jgi:hypothetical protein